MKKQVIYLATLAALTTGGTAIVHQINPDLIGTKIAHAGEPERAILVYPIDQRYLAFDSISGGPYLTSEGEQVYNSDLLGGLQRFAVRSSSPYFVKTYGDNVPDADQQYDEGYLRNDPSYLWTVYAYSFSPKDPNSGLKTLVVPFVSFDDDGGGMSQFFSKYVSNANTYTISDLKNALSSMDDASFNNYGFGTYELKYGSKAKLIQAIDTVLSSYNAVSAAAGNSAAAVSVASSTSSVANSSDGSTSSSVTSSSSASSSSSSVATNSDSPFASSTSNNAATTSNNNISATNDTTATTSASGSANKTTKHHSKIKSATDKAKIKKAQSVVKHDQRKLKHAERKLKQAAKKSKASKKRAKETVQKAKQALNKAKKHLIELEK